MIAITIEREPTKNNITFGSLFIEDTFQCYTLEDAVRETPFIRAKPNFPLLNESINDWVKSWKIPHQTAIPFGQYEMKVTLSNRFKVYLPELKQVPSFDGIRIHSGNVIDDTDGCILVGRKKLKNCIGESRLALDAFMKIILREQIKNQKQTFLVDVKSL